MRQLMQRTLKIIVAKNNVVPIFGISFRIGIGNRSRPIQRLVTTGHQTRAVLLTERLREDHNKIMGIENQNSTCTAD